MGRFNGTLPRVLVACTISMALGVGIACSTTGGDVGPGGECFLATDCAPGLVCIEQQNHTRVCTDDLTEVEGEPPPTEEPAEGGANQPDGMTQADAPTEPQPDASTMPDTGQPPADSGSD